MNNAGITIYEVQHNKDRWIESQLSKFRSQPENRGYVIEFQKIKVDFTGTKESKEEINLGPGSTYLKTVNG